MSTPKPIKFAFSDEALERLARRLSDTQLPEQPVVAGASWEHGTELSKLKQLVADWTAGAPKGSNGAAVGGQVGVVKWWRGVEERLNRHPHFQVEVEGVTLHYQIARSDDPDAVPLIFSHGWPGSFFEADLIIDDLIKPKDGGIAFHVVVPSLVGYGMSDGPPRTGWTLEDTARLFNKLMTDVLGFESYAAQGGDWGYVVTRLLSLYPACKAFHSNFVIPNPPWYAIPALASEQLGFKGISSRLMSYAGSEFEVSLLKRALQYVESGQGYYHIQSTKPASLGYALYDSPVGVLSWLLDKFEAWSDPKCPAFAASGNAETSSGVNDENILINATIYYLSNSIHTSMLPYKESKDLFNKLSKNKAFTAAAARKPFGHSAFPYELAGGPKAWIPSMNLNLVFYRAHTYGGHFAALDAPDVLTRDLRDFFSAHWPR